MSFFKSLRSEFEGLRVGDKDREAEYSAQRDYPPPQHYGSGPRSQQGYDYGSSAPPPSDHEKPPGPTYSPPSDKPPIPSGWIPQWDHNYQRWFYIEQATGRSQWEAPGYVAVPSTMPEAEDRGYGGHNYPPAGGYAGYGQGGGGYASHPYGTGGEQREEKSHSGMLLGAAGGLAVGAIGGAMLANALDDSDDEHHHQAAYAPTAEYAAPQYDEAPMPPPVLPPVDAYGDEVSSSDRESVQEAREDYEEALAEAADSDASSSEQEELEEAREEYQEEYEEAYYDE
ncbi:hypothetical protein NKR23_g4330 [Pleurostoma richardsiae]|uniref:WW domain-containing protein n=1 Tax=Pleurostoma richardsiae TaxID=41990 RepID=A0AA38VV96_9PEZI|nr:hypothetical protein NKR23_g4330 [Pleurostoma richardsiae]